MVAIGIIKAIRMNKKVGDINRKALIFFALSALLRLTLSGMPSTVVICWL